MPRMGNLSPSLRGVSLIGRILYGLGVAGFLVLILLTLTFGTLSATLFATLLLALFMISAPFVLGARWRRRQSQPTRRPVVRRRRV